MGNLSGPSVGALIVLIIAIIFAVVSMATNHWGDYDLKTSQGIQITKNKGLIKLCTESLRVEICLNFVDQPDVVYEDYLKACLGAMVLGFLSTAAALVVWILWMLGLCSSGTIMTILKIATIILLGCGIFWVLIAVIVFAAKDKDETEQNEGLFFDVTVDYRFGYSWGFGIVTVILQGIALVLMCIAPTKVDS